jgi:hypothetical protein
MISTKLWVRGDIHFALVPLSVVFIKMPAADELLLRYRLHKQNLDDRKFGSRFALEFQQ